jgi:muramoyltetrapeptide carboxypeptidase LdcA involved in peptidoglycan recycling
MSGPHQIEEVKPMNPLQKPQALQEGDTVATVSLSWGGAGDEPFRWRYEIGKYRLESQFGLQVVEMSHTLSGAKFIYEHPELRARDFMDAFRNPKIKAIFSCIGGDDSIRLIPYIDFEVLRANPKIFIGYSDTTACHLMCFKAGITSFYGPSILGEFAENNQIFPYTIAAVFKTLFQSEPLGMIHNAEAWTGERVEWKYENRFIQKKLEANAGIHTLQGVSNVRGRLFGGCMEVLEMAKGTILWPDLKTFEDCILFLETSEEMPRPDYVGYWLRNYGAMGVLHRIQGIVFAKPYQGKYQSEYHQVIQTILAEFSLSELPVLTNLTFGHNQPMTVLPYGALAEIDCVHSTFTILESGVE